MWEWSGYLCTAVLLAYHSISDIRRQRIPGASLALGVVVSCCWALCRGMQGSLAWGELAAALAPGAIALLLARATRGQIGQGDGWELVIMGNWMGLPGCLLALGVALLGIFFTSAALLLLGRVKRYTRIAFVPFLWVGTMAAMLCAGGT